MLITHLCHYIKHNIVNNNNNDDDDENPRTSNNRSNWKEKHQYIFPPILSIVVLAKPRRPYSYRVSTSKSRLTFSILLRATTFLPSHVVPRFNSWQPRRQLSICVFSGVSSRCPLIRCLSPIWARRRTSAGAACMHARFSMHAYGAGTQVPVIDGKPASFCTCKCVKRS